MSGVNARGSLGHPQSPIRATPHEPRPATQKVPKFDFQVDSGAGTAVVDSGLISPPANLTAGPCEPVSWQVPAGKLAWGQSYYWTVQAYDGTNYSPGAVWNSLTVQVPQPVITSLLSQNPSGHGVDPAIGNYTTAVTDADVATVGPSPTVERDYNSLDPRTSARSVRAGRASSTPPRPSSTPASPSPQPRDPATAVPSRQRYQHSELSIDYNQVGKAHRTENASTTRSSTGR